MQYFCWSSLVGLRHTETKVRREEKGFRDHGANFQPPPGTFQWRSQSFKFNLFPEFIIVVFLKESVTPQSKKFSQIFKAKSKPIQTLEYKLKILFANQIHFFQVYINFGPETNERMSLLWKWRIEKYNINMSDVYSVLLTFFVSETQNARVITHSTKSLLALQTVCHGTPWSNEQLLRALCTGLGFPRYRRWQPGARIFQRKALLTWCTPCLLEKGAQLVSCSWEWNYRLLTAGGASEPGATGLRNFYSGIRWLHGYPPTVAMKLERVRVRTPAVVSSAKPKGWRVWVHYGQNTSEKFVSYRALQQNGQENTF